MKIGGQAVNKPQDEIIVLPRGEQTFVFKAQAVLDYTEFEKLCSEPEAPIRQYPDGRKETLYTDPKFLKKKEEWAAHRSEWLIVESLKATEGIEWDTVNYNDPDTWKNYRKELESVFTTGEINMIIGGVMKANSLDDSKFEEARRVFFAKQQQA
jgi:hypothetical protein